MSRPPIPIVSIDAPTREGVRPLAPAVAPPAEPYRVLFPLGAILGVLGVLPWLFAAIGLGAWPGMLHAAVMLQGFELCFVAGFLLTAMPAFTHGPRATPLELRAVVAGVLLFATLRFAGLEWPAHAAFALTLAFLMFSLARRVRFGAAAPPEEFALVGVGLLVGVTGGAWEALAAAGVLGEPAPRLALRLVERGMVLALVLGLGGLLVPTFAMMKDPIAIAGIARAGQRRPRRAFVLALAAGLVGALVLEALGHDRAGAWLRAAVGVASTQLAWKLWRAPGRRDRLSWSLWGAGWGVSLGLLAAAIWPAREIAAWHVVLIAGYGLLTLAIGTRVVVSHGGHAMGEEGRVLHAGVAGALLVALVLRVAADGAGPHALAAYAGAAIAWTMAWSLWLAGVLPRVRRR